MSYSIDVYKKKLGPIKDFIATLQHSSTPVLNGLHSYTNKILPYKTSINIVKPINDILKRICLL